MQIRCVKAFGNARPGDDPVEVPDDAAVDPEYWEVVPPAPAPPPAPKAPVLAAPAATVPPAVKEA